MLNSSLTVGEYRGLKNEELILSNGIKWLKENGLPTKQAESELAFLNNRIEVLEVGILEALDRKNEKAVATAIATA